MTTRLAAAIVSVSLVSLLVATIVGLTAGRDLGNELFEDRLVAMSASASYDVDAHMAALRRTAEALASSPQAVVALDAFGDAYRELLTIAASELEEEGEALVVAYQERYIEPLQRAGRDLDLRDIATESLAGIYLQFHYAVDLGALAEPELIVDPRDGSAWTDVHRVVHPVYRDVVERRGLFDLYLVEPEDGIVVYSVQKRPDLGTSLDTGPFSGSLLAGVTDQLREDPSIGVITSDLSFYDPALTTPVGVVASPVMEGDRLAGVLVLMYDSAPITDLLTAGGDWDAARFPETGETFLLGADGIIRSEPRSFIEDPQAYLDEAETAGLLTRDERAAIEAAGTTVLTQRVADATVAAARGGDDRVQKRPTTVGSEAFSSAVDVAADDLAWWVVAELEVGAAERDLGDFQEVLIVGAAIFVVVLAFLAVGWAGGIVRPVRAISDRLGSDLRAGDRVDVPPRSPIEFHQLASSFESMSQALLERQTRLESAREDRLRLLRRLLPPNVAERVAAGDVKALEEVPEASVVVVVLGFDVLVDLTGDRSDRELVDRVHADLDELADRHGLERVKVVGDAYFAACGHDRPYLDHASRAVGFAADARDAVREISQDAPAEVDVSVGIDVGPVTVGMTGGTRMIYDVWGASVTHAHNLARRAERGQILVSDEARRRLPDTIEMTRQGAGEQPAWEISSTSIGRRP